MKYHDAELYNYLKSNDVTPELYATPWFLTLFASIFLNKFQVNCH
jgi:hypothetical protein